LKATGIVRKLDIHGKLYLPKEARRYFGLEADQLIEIYYDGEFIHIAKYRPQCIFCNNSEDLTEYDKKYVCENCMNNLRTLVQLGG